MNAWKSENWIAASCERAHAGVHILLGIARIVHRARSPWQEIVIADTPTYGRALFLDGDPQLLQADEWIYHERLALAPLLFHAAPRRALIIGGGDGLALRELLRDSRLHQIVLVDLDAAVIDACRAHLADLHRGSFDDARARIVVDDARAYLERADAPFDIALIDLTDASDAAGVALYTEVLTRLKRVLAPDAIVSAQVSSLDPPAYRALHLRALLARHFAHTALHRAYVPSFMREWGFVLAADDVAFERIDPDLLITNARRITGPLRALRPDTLAADLVLPPYLDAIQQRILALPSPALPVDASTFRWIERDDHASTR